MQFRVQRSDGSDPVNSPAAASRPEAVIRDHGAETCREARERERDISPAGWNNSGGPNAGARRRVALIVAKRTGNKVGVDTATRMAKDADR